MGATRIWHHECCELVFGRLVGRGRTACLGRRLHVTAWSFYQMTG